MSSLWLGITVGGVVFIICRMSALLQADKKPQKKPQKRSSGGYRSGGNNFAGDAFRRQQENQYWMNQQFEDQNRLFNEEFERQQLDFMDQQNNFMQDNFNDFSGGGFNDFGGGGFGDFGGGFW